MGSVSAKLKNVTTHQAARAACIVFVAGLLSGTALVPVSSARADDTGARLNRIERDIETLNRAVYKGETPPSGSVSSSSGSAEYQASVETRLTDMESQIRDLTGKIEQQGYDIQQLKTKLDKSMSDMSTMQQMGAAPASAQMQAPQTATQSGTLQASDMGGPVQSGTMTAPASATPVASAPETAPTAAPTAAVPTPAIGDLNAPAPANSPTQQNLGTLTEAPGGASIQTAPGNDPAGQYEMAFSLLKSGNYQASRNGFDEFLKKYPEHPLAGNAMYWMGEGFYGEGNYEKATRVFAESYKKYPKGPKAADSLLKLALSLGKLGKTEQACVTIQQLKKEYPVGQADILKKADQESASMGCGG